MSHETRDEFIKGMEGTLKQGAAWSEGTYSWRVYYVLRPFLQRSKSLDHWFENHEANDLYELAKWLDDKLTISEKYEMDKIRQVDELREKIRRADYWLNISIALGFIALVLQFAILGLK